MDKKYSALPAVRSFIALALLCSIGFTGSVALAGGPGGGGGGATVSLSVNIDGIPASDIPVGSGFQLVAVNVPSKAVGSLYVYNYDNTTASGYYESVMPPAAAHCSVQSNGTYTCMWDYAAGWLTPGNWSFKLITLTPVLKTLAIMVPGIIVE